MAHVAANTNKTTRFFYKLNLIIYIFGFPNFWIEDLNLSKRFIKIYDGFTDVNNASQYLLILLELGGFFTQHNLSQKQRFNLWLYAISHPILCSYRLIMTYHKKNVKLVLRRLTVDLKKVYNDLEVEKQMIAKSKLYCGALIFSCVLSMCMYVFDASMEMVRSDVTYTTIITVYPDIEDNSTTANVTRGILNLIWWIFVTRICALFLLVIPLATCLSHQYKNLQSYFYSLNEIFERNELSQKEKEDHFESQFKVGIKMHEDTLWCSKLTQTVCSEVFSGQIIFNVVLIVVLMAQMVKSERNLFNLCATIFTATSILIGTGFFMWNAGDVTIEASQLSTAMYFSGWHNCQGISSTRIRKLVSIAMTHAQRPVVLKGLGYIGLSYESYLRIVKSSYSVFSVLF